MSNGNHEDPSLVMIGFILRWSEDGDFRLLRRNFVSRWHLSQELSTFPLETHLSLVNTFAVSKSPLVIFTSSITGHPFFYNPS